MSIVTYLGKGIAPMITFIVDGTVWIVETLIFLLVSSYEFVFGWII